MTRGEYSVLSTQYARVRVLPPFLTAAAALVLSSFLTVPASSLAKPLSDEQAVESGKQALSSVTRFPWYDRGQDKARRLHVVPRENADSENRGSSWTNNNTTTATGGAPGRRSSLFGPALQWVGLSALIFLLGVLAYLIAKAFLKEELTESTVQRMIVESSTGVDRVEALPLKVRTPAGDFLAEARRLFEAGQYSEAIIYLFSHELLALDKHHLIRLAKGKTNRQYLREVRQLHSIRTILETTMVAFEDAFFGRKALSRERFEQCWQELDELHTELTARDDAA